MVKKRKAKIVLFSILLGVLLLVVGMAALVIIPTPASAQDTQCCMNTASWKFCSVVFEASECTTTLLPQACEAAADCSIGCCVQPDGTVDTRAAFSCNAIGGRFQLGTEQPYDGTTEDLGCEISCASDADCGTGMRCATGRCEIVSTPLSCTNRIKDGADRGGTETDIDCGGSCAPCSAAKACRVNTDCDSGFCDSGVCQAAVAGSCGNNIVNTDAGEECDGRAFPRGTTACDGMTLDESTSTRKIFCTPPDPANPDAECKIDRTGCEPAGPITPPPPPPVLPTPAGICGDEITQTPNLGLINEQCDGNDDACAVFRTAHGKCTNDDPDMSPPSKCQCFYECIDDPGAAALDPIQYQDEQATLTIRPAIKLGCRIIGAAIERCNEREGACDVFNEHDVIGFATPDPASPSAPILFVDTAMEPGARYCYKAAVKLTSGVMVESGQHCIETGDEVCFGLPAGASICNDDKTAVITCGEDNTKTETACTEACMGGSKDDGRGGTIPAASCIGQPECRTCNGLFQAFGGVIPPPLSQQIEDTVCSDILGCGFDVTETAADKYYDCKDVTSCYDYHSWGACSREGFADPCRVGPCSWKSMYGDLGIGICSPQDETLQDCSQCNTLPDDPVFNAAFLNSCTEDLCTAYGSSCAFTGSNECKQDTEIVCEDYVTEESCNGRGTLHKVGFAWLPSSGINFEIDGNHDVVLVSDDMYGYGVCRWAGDPETGACFKDYNMDNLPDCSVGMASCQHDKTPPSTQIVPVIESVLPTGFPPRFVLGQDMDLPITVSEPATTYFCVADPGASCTPEIPALCRMQEHLDGTGNRELRFYSQDKSHNLEPIQTRPVWLDTQPPAVTITPAYTPEEKTLTITMGLNEPAVCNAELLDGDLNVVPALPDTAASNGVEEEVSSSDNFFSRTYYQLEDNIYFWVYDCTDGAGNTAEGYTSIMDVDSNGIVNPEPIITFESAGGLEVQSPASECRYSKTIQTFENMKNPMIKTGNLHQAALTSDDLLPGRNIFSIRCKFADNSVQGNKGDRMIISRDVAKPTVRLVEGYGKAATFDPSIEYAVGQTVFIECDDNHIDGGMVSNAGCKDTTFTLTGAGGTITQQATISHDGKLHAMAGPIRITDVGANTLEYTVTDRTSETGYSENTVHERHTVTIVSEEKHLAIQLYAKESGQDMTEAAAIPPDVYEIVVSSNHLLDYDSTRLSVTVAELPPASMPGAPSSPSSPPASRSLAPVEDRSKSTSLKKVFTLDLGAGRAISKGAIYQLVIQANGVVSTAAPPCFAQDGATDTAELAATMETTIDARIVDIRLEPMLQGSTTGPSGVDYHVKYEHGEYLTNQDSLFVTGRLLDPDITTVVLLSTNTWEGAYPLRDNAPAAADETTTTPTVGIAEIGSADVRVANPEKIPPSALGTYVKFRNHDRTSYGHYRDLYQVRGISGDTVTLTEPLERAIGTAAGGGDTFVEAYTKKHLHDWFGLEVPFEEGRNDLRVTAQSVSGAYSAPIVAIVQRDTIPPELVRKEPGELITSEDIPSITVIMRDTASGTGLNLAAAKLQLLVNNAPKPVTVEEITPEIEGFRYFKMTHAPASPYREGTYTVKVVAEDKAGNAMVPETDLAWTIRVDRSAATPPQWSVVDGTLEEGTWYTSSSAVEIILNFSANPLPVVITGMIVRPYGTTTQYPIGRECEEGKLVGDEWVGEEGTNIFKCRLTAPLAENQKLILGVRAHKVLTTGPLEDVIYTSEPIVVDTTTPNVQTLLYESPAKLEEPLLFYAAIPNEHFDLGAELAYSVDGTTYDLVPAGNDGNGNYAFIWNVPFMDVTTAEYADIQNDKEFQMRIFDHAGHEWTATRLIKIDAIAPLSSDVSFTVHANYGTDATREYYTNTESLRITGSYSGSDIRNIYLVPGSYDPVVRDYAAKAYPLKFPPNQFEFNIKLKGAAEDIVENPYELVAADDAGNTISIPFTVWYDQTVPDQPQIIIQ